jgi:hypothetical protein
VWLCYLGDAGDAEPEGRGGSPHVVIALMVPEDRALELARAVRAVVAELLPARVSLRDLVGGTPVVPELRGADLFRCAGAWSQVDLPACNQAYWRALGLLEPFGCEVAVARIDHDALRAEHGEPRRERRLGLQVLAAKLDEWLATQREPWRQRGLVVVDRRHEHEDLAVGLVADLPRWGSPVGPRWTLTRLVDTVHFVPSVDNPGVQLADLVAFAMHHADAMPRADARGAGDWFVDVLVHELIEPRIRKRTTFP